MQTEPGNANTSNSSVRKPQFPARTPRPGHGFMLAIKPLIFLVQDWIFFDYTLTNFELVILVPILFLSPRTDTPSQCINIGSQCTWLPVYGIVTNRQVVKRVLEDVSLRLKPCTPELSLGIFECIECGLRSRFTSASVV